ncbi:hypothetical protein ACFTZI_18605 [Streptomyces decoyicus]|uniref:hypothetical protein n=1 Tax=Streptomyces decoyicus TaxID=249567 RepID=UPI00362D3981
MHRIGHQVSAAPAFAYVVGGEFPSLGGPALAAALAQAMVDERHHTPRQLNAGAFARHEHGISPPDTVPPSPRLVRQLRLVRPVQRLRPPG